MGRVIHRWSDDIFFEYEGKGSSLQCWVTTEGQGSSVEAYNDSIPGLTMALRGLSAGIEPLHTTVDYFAARRLQETESFDFFHFIAGHVIVVDRCLEVLSEECWWKYNER